MDAHDQNTQQQGNGTTADCRGNSHLPDQWKMEHRIAPITADLCDVNDAV